jgi:hypothetical protein
MVSRSTTSAAGDQQFHCRACLAMEANLNHPSWSVGSFRVCTGNTQGARRNGKRGRAAISALLVSDRSKSQESKRPYITTSLALSLSLSLSLLGALSSETSAQCLCPECRSSSRLMQPRTLAIPPRWAGSRLAFGAARLSRYHDASWMLDA